MRLYSFRQIPDDGCLYYCLRNKNGALSMKNCKRDYNGHARRESIQPYQAAVIEVVTGGEDRVNVTYLQTISGYIFCTPRCYTTKSWEVGICNSYQLKYLYGGRSPTSFDFHILMILELVQVYLQQIEIREQSVGYFYVPDNLQVALGLPRKLTEIPEGCRKIWNLILSLNQSGKNIGMSVTAKIAHLNIIRREYFNDLHLDTNLTKGSAHRLFLKLLGHLHSRIGGLLQTRDIIIRQYYGQCPFQDQVRGRANIYLSNV